MIGTYYSQSPSTIHEELIVEKKNILYIHKHK